MLPFLGEQLFGSCKPKALPWARIDWAFSPKMKN